MKINAVLFIAIAITPIVSVAQRDRRLEGCVDPKIVATVLAKLPQSDSRAFSVKQLRAIWPDELSDVEHTKTDVTLRSDDRVLKSNCQCCTEFTLNVQADRQELTDVVINYSEHRRDSLVTVSKIFAEAVGLRERDRRTIGNHSTQSYRWQTQKSGETRLYALDIRFTREVAGLWKMYFLVGFNVIEPIGAPPKD